MHDTRRTKQDVDKSSQTTWASVELVKPQLVNKQNLQYDTSPVQGKIKQEKQQQGGINLVLQYIMMRWQDGGNTTVSMWPKFILIASTVLSKYRGSSNVWKNI